MPRLYRNKTEGQPKFFVDKALHDFVRRMTAGTYGLSYGQLLTRAIDLLEPGQPDYEPVGALEWIFPTSLLDLIHAAKLDSFVTDGQRRSTVMRNALARLMAVYDQPVEPKQEVKIETVTINENQDQPENQPIQN